MSLTIITGWIAAILLFFNFATCLAMPWANKKFKECVEGEGHGCHAENMLWYHKPIVILSVIAIIVHIVVSLVY